MAKKQTVTLHDVEIKSFQDSDDNIMVDKVIFKTVDEPQGATVPQISFKPRTQEVTKHTIKGIETTETNTVRYELAQFATEYEWIKELQDKLNAGKQVELTARVSLFDQRTLDGDEGDDVYAYIDSDDEPSLEVKIPEDSE